MSKMMGGFAGKPLTPESGWGMVKLFIGMLPACMIANKFLQGNIWGIPNRESGIIPIREVTGNTAERYVDVYIHNSLDTSGFVGAEADEAKERAKAASQSRVMQSTRHV